MWLSSSRGLGEGAGAGDEDKSWVESRAKGELHFPHHALDAKNLDLGKIDIWGY